MKTRYYPSQLIGWLLVALLLGTGSGPVAAQDTPELKLVFPVGHTGPVFTCVFSPDGNRVLTAAQDQTAKVWDVQTGAVLLDLKGHSGAVNAAAYSRDGLRIATASTDSTVQVWDARDGLKLLELRGHQDAVSWVSFSADGLRLVTASPDKTARLWDAQSGRQLLTLTGHTDRVLTAMFSPDGRRVVTAAHDHLAKVWDASTGAVLFDLDGDAKIVRSATYSADGTRIVTAGVYGAAGRIWDANSGRLLHTYRNMLYGNKNNLTYAVLSGDGTRLATSSIDQTTKIWDVQQDKVLLNLKGHHSRVECANFSPDGRYVVTCSFDGTAIIWDARRGTSVLTSEGTPEPLEVPRGIVVLTLKGRSSQTNYAALSADSRLLATAGSDYIVRLWDARRGVLLRALGGYQATPTSVDFSPDGTQLAAGYYDGKVRVWDTRLGTPLLELNHGDRVATIAYSPDGTQLAAGGYDKRVRVWNTQSGAVLFSFKAHRNPVFFVTFSPDGTMLLTTPLVRPQLLRTNFDYMASLWSARTGKHLLSLDETRTSVWHADFSPDSKRLVTTSNDKNVSIWDVATGKQLLRLDKHPYVVVTARFNVDGTRLTTTCGDKARTWNATTGEEFLQLAQANVTECYSRPQGAALLTSFNGVAELRNPVSQELLARFVPVDSADYLVVDKDSHFDGTLAARQQVFFACGTERIGLDQVKEQLWVPGLLERLHRGEVIKGKKLAELNLCGLTPEVKALPGTAASYRYQIVPRRGGLREVVLSVNGIEVRRRTPAQLTKTAKGYEWVVTRAELLPYFVAGLPNVVTAKAYTLKDGVASRGAELVDAGAVPAAARPNLYAVMIGVSNYQGTDLDLTYAAKDAQDLADAVERSARKLLNSDQREHVFLYRLNTATGPAPGKAAIRQAFEDIGRKARSNDIVLVFFAGHGVVAGDKRQFYLLTADASRESARSTVAQVGISTQELAEWLRPDRLRAQKRVLILDACNSGQAINDLVKIGDARQQYVAARGDDQAQQVKDIERLNEKSGMFILSAAASDQRAYEMAQYSQGLLTYALLEAIKNKPDILDGRSLLNLNRWFNAAGQTVSDLGRELGVRQQPQVVQTATGFSIGVVDAEVLAAIMLARQKPLFSGSGFQNQDPTIASDNLEVNVELNKALGALAKGVAAPLAFTEYASLGGDTYALTGRYQVQGTAIKLVVDVRRGKALLTRFEESGTTSDLPTVLKLVAAHAVAWVEAHK